MSMPKILAGPVLRRVEKDQVTIWIATSKQFQIQSSISTIKKTNLKVPYKYQRIDVQTKVKTIPLGRQIYIHLLTISPKSASFPTETLLGYNLFLKDKTSTFDLSDVGLLDSNNDASIVYGNLRYPTFFISQKKETSIFYGSCRKPHGTGDDSLVSGDIYLEQNHLLLSKRPSCLFLLGDQIYADDIADPLLPIFSSLRKELFGKEKSEDLSKVEPKLLDENYKNELFQIQGRQEICDQLCKFTSNSAGNHLLYFHEFTLMYLMNWSPELWKIAAENNYYSGDVHEKNGFFEDFSSDQHDERDFDSNQYQSQLGSIKQFQDNLSKVRRLLANTPTYMIFDDHDVTDDWNLSYKWMNQVCNAPLGRHVVNNALTAYWLFQGWGNDPESFDDTFIKKITNYLQSYDVDSVAYRNWQDLLWNYQGWHFVAPTNPPALFINTRTERAYELEKENGPRLLNRKAYQTLSKLLKGNGRKHKGSPLLLVSPAPVYGLNLIENFLKNYVYPLRALGIPVHRMMDLESWAFNNEGFSQFISWILNQNYRNCIILSGDAHYAYSVHSKVNYQNKKMNIYQLTSSPLKNESFPKLFSPLINSIVSLEAKRLQNNGSKLTEGTDSTNIIDLLWTEKNKDLPIEDHSMLELDNNLGVVTISNNSQIHTLLLKYNYSTKRVHTTNPLTLT